MPDAARHAHHPSLPLQPATQCCARHSPARADTHRRQGRLGAAARQRRSWAICFCLRERCHRTHTGQVCVSRDDAVMTGVTSIHGLFGRRSALVATRSAILHSFIPLHQPERRTKGLLSALSPSPLLRTPPIVDHVFQGLCFLHLAATHRSSYQTSAEQTRMDVCAAVAVCVVKYPAVLLPRVSCIRHYAPFRALRPTPVHCWCSHLTRTHGRWCRLPRRRFILEQLCSLAKLRS